jgi:hypothetical protein
MKLARLATVQIPTERANWPNFDFGSYQIHLLSSRKANQGTLLLIAAIVGLEHRLKRTADNKLVIPVRLRRSAEEVIEHYANLLSISNFSRRQISSPAPSVALISETPLDDALLQGATGFFFPEANNAVPSGAFELNLEKHLNQLEDRLDGVALLAEGICHQHSTGRFHESIRLYERAFGVGGHRLIRPLADFLAGSGHGYSACEVKRWMVIRDGTIHADRRNNMLFEGDVTWIVERVMQANYDVLLNKLVWRSDCTNRRNVWQPVCGTSSPGCDIFGTQGSDFKIRFKLFDQFNRFPLNLGVSFRTLPPQWWAGAPGAADQAGRTSNR